MNRRKGGFCCGLFACKQNKSKKKMHRIHQEDQKEGEAKSPLRPGRIRGVQSIIIEERENYDESNIEGNGEEGEHNLHSIPEGLRESLKGKRKSLLQISSTVQVQEIQV